MESLNNPKKELKSFWRTDGMDKVADLGEMKKAVVVAYYTPIGSGNYYSISPRSYFPFNYEQGDKKFDNYYDCCLYAESIIIGWVSSLLMSDKYEVKSLDGLGNSVDIIA
ncbi:MAG: hypothetical protein IPJ01_11445 [Micavibrio sp.]|nr:hypothetical protein [Micavibrio sp.]